MIGRSELPLDLISSFLRENFVDLKGDLSVSRTEGGFSNPTYFVRVGDWQAVLRKQPASVSVKSAHAIDREFRVMSALHGSGVPVPKPLLYHEAKDVLDTPFYIMEKIEGRVFDEYEMPGVIGGRRDYYRAMCQSMAAMHKFDWQAAGLSDYGKPGNYFIRQFNGWSRQWEKFEVDDNPFIDQMIEWLSDNIPDSELLTICHGDFRVPNVMFHQETAQVVGILDWELSTLGHPLADVAFNTQAYHMAPDENGGLLGLDLPALGIPEESEYLDWYYELSGCEEQVTTFHRVFAMFRAAVGSAGIAARGLAGNAFTSDAAITGNRLAQVYARRGIDILMNEA